MTGEERAVLSVYAPVTLACYDLTVAERDELIARHAELQAEQAQLLAEKRRLRSQLGLPDDEVMH
jgi:hypothetical protein